MDLMQDGDRICSLLSLNPYFGTLVRRFVLARLHNRNADTLFQIPCLKEMVCLLDFLRPVGLDDCR